MPAKKTSYKKSVPYQKAGPINLPGIVILLILLLGLAIVIGLVQIPQIFKSRADSSAIKFTGDGVTVSGDSYSTTKPTVQVTLTSPYTSSSSNEKIPTPDYEDSLNTKSKYPLSEAIINGKKVNAFYENGMYRVMGWTKDIQPGDEFIKQKGYTSGGTDFKRINPNLKELSLIFEFQQNGSDSDAYTGAFLGSLQADCEYAYGLDCYRFTISKSGWAELDYQEKPIYTFREVVKKEKTGITLENGKWYTMRIDRSKSKLSAWLSSDGGNTWSILAKDWPLDPNKATSQNFNFNGFVIGSDLAAKNRVNGSNDAYFKNLKVWSLGRLPEKWRKSEMAIYDIKSDKYFSNILWRSWSQKIFCSI
jgi:hypothetical protein